MRSLAARSGSLPLRGHVDRYRRRTERAVCHAAGTGTRVGTQPVIRAVDYRLADAFVRKILIIPIVHDATNETQNSITLFAYFYLTGENAHGANGYLPGYVIRSRSSAGDPGRLVRLRARAAFWYLAALSGLTATNS